MKKNIFEQRGKVKQLKNIVLGFDEFVEEEFNHMNENITFELNKDYTSVQLDTSCIDSVWEVIESECGGDIVSLKKYIAKGTDADYNDVSQKQIIHHIMNLVKDYLHNKVTIEKGHQHITSLEKFTRKGKEVDFVSVVDSLVCKLYGEEDDAPKYVDMIIDILDTTTDFDGGEEGKKKDKKKEDEGKKK